VTKVTNVTARPLYLVVIFAGLDVSLAVNLCRPYKLQFFFAFIFIIAFMFLISGQSVSQYNLVAFGGVSSLQPAS